MGCNWRHGKIKSIDEITSLNLFLQIPQVVGNMTDKSEHANFYNLYQGLTLDVIGKVDHYFDKSH